MTTKLDKWYYLQERW